MLFNGFVQADIPIRNNSVHALQTQYLIVIGLEVASSVHTTHVTLYHLTITRLRNSNMAENVSATI